MHHDHSASEEFVFVCPARLECVLAAGGIDELDELRAWCEQLPQQSYGKVFVEADRPEQIETLPVPVGVSVTWLLREDGEQPGYALAPAVDAWLDEWVRVDFESERHLRLYTGARSSEAMRCYWMRLEHEFAAA